MIDSQKYEFNPEWLIGLIERAPKLDPYLWRNNHIIKFLMRALPHCRLKSIRLNPDYATNVNYIFDETQAVAEDTVEIKVPFSIQIYGDQADLNFDVSENRKISKIEVWHHVR